MPNWENRTLRKNAPNLEGHDFSKENIQGADFTNANLRGANFTGAKAGLQRCWVIGLILVSWLLSGILGFTSVFIGFLLELLHENSKSGNFYAGVISVLTLTVFFTITNRKGLLAGLGGILFAGAISAFITGIFSFFSKTVTLTGSTISTFAASGIVAGVFTGVVAGAIAGVVGGGRAVIGASTVALTAAAVGSLTVVKVIFKSEAMIGGSAIVLFSIYIGWRALKGDQKNAWVRSFAIAFAATGGTSFRGADLTDANFTDATLRNTDFRNANLTRTCWYKTKIFEYVRPGKTYLQNAKLRQLLITRQGQKQNFDQQNLRSINLQGANLEDTSFIAADLSESNLKDVNLSRAKLVQTQLDQADLTGATLTGACIEEWNISTDTKLHGISCDYIFMRLPPDKRPDFLTLPPEESLDPNPRRKPDDWDKNFAAGEFTDFITPLLQTLDLYHNKAVNPQFIAIAFQQLKESYPEAELEIISIEKKGKERDKLHLKVETSLQADTSVLHKDYFSNLDCLQSLPLPAQQALLAERGEMIKLLAGLLGSGNSQNPEISIVNNNHQNMNNRNININDGNYNEEIKGNYTEGNSSEGGTLQ